jgi:hypothetical protein
MDKITTIVGEAPRAQKKKKKKSAPGVERTRNTN